MADHAYDIHSPSPRFPESEDRVIEVKQAENAARTGVTRQAPFEAACDVALPQPRTPVTT